MSRSKTRGARLAVREARLITKELRHLGVPPGVIAKIWAAVIAVPVVFVLGYLIVHFDSGTSDVAILAGVRITLKDSYQSHVYNGTSITLKSLTLTCYPGEMHSPSLPHRACILRCNRDTEKMLTSRLGADSSGSMRVTNCGNAVRGFSLMVVGECLKLLNETSVIRQRSFTVFSMRTRRLNGLSFRRV